MFGTFYQLLRAFFAKHGVEVSSLPSNLLGIRTWQRIGRRSKFFDEIVQLLSRKEFIQKHSLDCFHPIKNKSSLRL